MRTPKLEGAGIGLTASFSVKEIAGEERSENRPAAPGLREDKVWMSLLT